MSTLCVIQARMGSTRLPGKVAADLGGRPMLQFMLDRLSSLHVDRLVIATSTLPADDPVADIAATADVPVVRGSEADVLDRFVRTLEVFPADHVVRLTADCPLVDPRLVEAVIDMHLDLHATYTSNSLIRTFPDGLDVEVVVCDGLRTAAARASDPDEREHVTPYLYRRPEEYVLAAYRNHEPLGHERWTVDTADDLERIRTMVAAMDDPVGAGWSEFLAAAGRSALPDPWLRPALASDAAVEDTLRGRAHAVVVGSGEPYRGLTERPTDPSVRTWILEQSREIAGWLQISVKRGVGNLTGRVIGMDRTAVEHLLRRTLAADFQVRELTCLDERT